jgi:cation diffusion facilitator CzcD-associated flavoprotein CzcO
VARRTPARRRGSRPHRPPGRGAHIGEFIREKIREIVTDPATAEALRPDDHPFAAKRPCLSTDCYATYNRPNVTLVNLREDPISEITATGVKTAHNSFDLDAIVFATGFDALTGAILAVHPITGRGGLPQPVHGDGAGQPLGAVEHAGVHRTARGLDRRSTDRDAR